MQFREMRGEDRLRLGKEDKTSSFVLLFARLALSLQIVCGHWPIWLSPITVL